MRATSLGHAGILIETDAGSILCDPWFVPAFHGAWFPFPRNDRLSDDLLARVEKADFLYLSHLHGDHQDEVWLRDHLRREVPILLPDHPTSEQERSLRRLGFVEFVRTQNATELELRPGLRVAIHVESSITDGPAGDSALVVSDGRHRLLDQNDCRTSDLDALRAHGPVDLHWLQHSGGIWYPMVYELDPGEMRRQCAAKIESQAARAVRYVEAVDARAVVPSAGPPVFLDDDLAHLNHVDGNEAAIFPDQTFFLRRLEKAGRRGLLAIPGTSIELHDDEIRVGHPATAEEIEAIFSQKAEYLTRYRADWEPWLRDLRSTWSTEMDDEGLLAAIRDWWEPLLRLAPALRAAVGGACLLRIGALAVLVDFPRGRVRAHRGEAYDFRFDLPRPLVEQVVRTRAVDWSNALLLSCRFRAWRRNGYNEYLYDFLKSLSAERIRRTETEVGRKRAGASAEVGAGEDVTVGDYVVQRRCPHRQADLARFGEIEGDTFVCRLHGWRFDLDTGACRTHAGCPLRIRRRGA
jgi:UDP-MurNAc hydroxylase